MQPPGASDRIVFVGDSITDGFTYPLMIQQALTEARCPVPAVCNAGVASDTAEMMSQRIERDVLPQRPTVVCLSAGVNDGLRGVTVEAYASSVTAICDWLAKEKISVILLTPTILGVRNAEKEKRIDQYITFLRKFADERHYQLADCNALMQTARKSGDTDIIMLDDVHLTYHGYEFMARAVLDVLGHATVSLPKELKPPVYAGLISHWKMRASPKPGEVLTDATIAAIRADNSWKEYEIPEKQPADGWWLDHERQRGAAVSLERLIGKAEHYQGFAILEEKASRKVVFHVGAALNSIWLNNQRIYQATVWKGWHLDRERVTAELKAGKNTLVIETGNQFILTVDDGR
jgi:lysophospholipase L1-like esterase